MRVFCFVTKISILFPTNTHGSLIINDCFSFEYTPDKHRIISVFYYCSVMKKKFFSQVSVKFFIAL